MQEARYWGMLSDGRVECRLCPHHCKLKEGQRGLCFGRQMRDGRLASTTYGFCSGYCVDPIEKKPLYHFLPGSTTFSLGTIGCNLNCRFCQNWRISHARNEDPLAMRADADELPMAAQDAGCRSVAFTYNEPIVFFEYALDAAQACHDAGLKTVAVTAGYIEKEPRREFFAQMDAANVDLKSFSPRFYKELCGAELAPILETLEFIRHETKTWLEITTLLIPGENDTPEELDALARWVAEKLGPDVPLHFSAFHPDGKMTDHPWTSPRTLQLARDIALKNGLRHVYSGNIRDPEGSATRCHQCGHTLIERDGFTVTGNHLAPQGRCPACATPCAGIW